MQQPEEKSDGTPRAWDLRCSENPFPGLEPGGKGEDSAFSILSQVMVKVIHRRLRRDLRHKTELG